MGLKFRQIISLKFNLGTATATYKSGQFTYSFYLLFVFVTDCRKYLFYELPMIGFKPGCLGLKATTVAT